MTKQLKLILYISIIASFVAFLDSSVVNVALPAIAKDLGGGLITQQWVVDAYLITLGSLILIAGSLSDLFGRKRILTYGLISFGITSMLCAIAPSNSFLIVARGLQGIAGALLVPSSLAIIIANFSGVAQSKAIGTWTAWTGISFIIGPLLGGFLIDTFSWRLIFAINIIPITICLALISKLKIKDQISRVKLDYVGALMCSLGLFGVVYSLIEQASLGWSNPLILIFLILGLCLLIGFIFYEKSINNAILPLSLFKVRNFSAGNLATISIYGGLSIATFIIVIYLQQVSGYTALEAGLALLPVTIIMFIFSPRFGKLSGKYGPRLFMTLGPIIGAIGFIFMLRVTTHVNYINQLLPGILIFALGLSMTVAPLTSAVLGDIEKLHSGIASAVNNAISRIAGLITIALIGIVVGQNINVRGFHKAVIATAILLIIGGLISYIGIRNRTNLKQRL
jgi:EmrB/QacA subfamily drug resistance transporter